MPSRILTVPQAAEKLQMNPAIVREYLRLGKMPGRKIGKAWRVLETDLENWVSSGKSMNKSDFVSARGILNRLGLELTSEDINESKRFEAELEEEKFQRHILPARKSA